MKTFGKSGDNATDGAERRTFSSRTDDSTQSGTHKNWPFVSTKIPRGKWDSDEGKKGKRWRKRNLRKKKSRWIKNY
jgi:hypothetical protein